jgi:competence protein ComEC
VDSVLLFGLAIAIGGVLSIATGAGARSAETWGPVLVLAVGLLALTVMRAKREGRRRGGHWGPIALAVLAIGLGAVRARRAIAAHEAALVEASAALPVLARCAARGIVSTAPVRVRGSPRWDAHIRDVECDGAPSRLAGDVTLYGGPDGLARGDDVEIVAQLAPPQRLWNDDLGDPRPGEARRGVVRSGGAVDVRVVVRGRGPLAWIDRARAHVRARIDATFPADTAPMARALVLGESDLDAADDAAFRASGLSHLLAVSGMHLVLVVAGAVAAMRAVLVRIEPVAARIDAGRLSAAIGIPAAWVYAELAGASGSTLRAAWMLSAALLARAIGRRTDAVRAFGLSLVAMASLDPLVAFDVSFVLSAAATGGLLAFSTPLSEAIGQRLPAWCAPVARSLGATIAATIPCAPILARFAPTVALGGIAANLLAVPIGESIALPMCLAHALLRGWPAAEQGCATAAAGALRIVRAIAHRFAAIPALAPHVPPPTGWQLVVIALGFAWFLLGPRRLRWSGVLIAAAIVLLAEVGARRAAAPIASLRVTFLDVGQGDAALVDLPDGQAVLIDGGGLVGSPVDTGTLVIAPMLRARRRGDLALAVLSHPHPDHVTGLASGLDGIRVGALWDSGQGEREGTAGAYAALLALARSRGTAVLRPGAICGPHAIGGARVDVLAPCPDTAPDRGANDNSIVVRIAYGDRAFLFVGDAEHEEEADLLRLPPESLRADVLKVGHHGSRTSSSPAFLRAVAPREAVISVGARNRFGHPHPMALGALTAAAARVWRTDRDGSIAITTDGDSLDVRTARGP